MRANLLSVAIRQYDVKLSSVLEHDDVEWGYGASNLDLRRERRSRHVNRHAVRCKHTTMNERKPVSLAVLFEQLQSSLS